MLPFSPVLGPPVAYIFPLNHQSFVINIPRPSRHPSHPSKLRRTLLSFVASYMY